MDSQAESGRAAVVLEVVEPGFVGHGRRWLPPESSPGSMPRPWIREPSRTLESFILLPLPGVVADPRRPAHCLGRIMRKKQALLEKIGPRCSRRDRHSQQAGTMISTLMLIPPAMPP